MFSRGEPKKRGCTPAGLTLAFNRLFEPDARPAAVLVDENDAVGFENHAQKLGRAVAQFAAFMLEIADSLLHLRARTYVYSAENQLYTVRGGAIFLGQNV